MNLFLRLVSEQAGTSAWEVVREPGAGKTDMEGWTGSPASVSLVVLVMLMCPACTSKEKILNLRRKRKVIFACREGWTCVFCLDVKDESSCCRKISYVISESDRR